MKKIVFMIFLSICINGFAQSSCGILWEDLSINEKKIISKDSTLSSLELEYKEGISVPCWKLLNNLEYLTMDTCQATLPIRYYYFCRILNDADGDVSEIIGKYCCKMIFLNPKCLLTYLASNSKLLSRFAYYIGYELYFVDEGCSNLDIDYKTFEETLRVQIKEQILINALNRLLYEIKNTMSNMDD